jgi:hypothetical protein
VERFLMTQEVPIKFWSSKFKGQGHVRDSNFGAMLKDREEILNGLYLGNNNS